MSRERTTLPGGWQLTALLAVAVVVAGVARIAQPVRAVEDAPALIDVHGVDMRIDLATASVEELALLPGIGPALGERIVDDRIANGPPPTLESLMRVHGVGPRLIERIEPHVVVGVVGTEPAEGR